MSEQVVEKLWQDYRFLTKEMLNFLTQQKMELFYNLLDQRRRLQGIIEQAADDHFKASLEGQRLFTEIQNVNQLIVEGLQTQINRSKKSHYVVEIYTGANNKPVGRMNWKG